jgi:hypothetical protein
MPAFRRLLLGLLVLAILATPVVAVLNGWVGGGHWPMKRLQVTAPFAFVDQEKVRAAAMPHLKDGFFAVDLKAINAKLQALHWVERVEVRKQWPDTLIVQIHEYRPLAVWNGKQMLAEQGSVFAMPKAKLPCRLSAVIRCKPMTWSRSMPERSRCSSRSGWPSPNSASANAMPGASYFPTVWCWISAVTMPMPAWRASWPCCRK